MSDDLNVRTSAVENPGQVVRVPTNPVRSYRRPTDASHTRAVSAFAPKVARVTTLAGVHAVSPPHRYTQAELTAAFTEICLGAAALTGAL